MSGSAVSSRSSRHRSLRTRAAAVTALAGGAVLLSAVPAFAHVTVQPATAAKGSYSTVAFKVPNEQDSASTVRVEVNLPADHPIASVSLQPVPGWTAKVTTSKLTTPLKTDDGTVDQAVTKIVWSGGKIAPGQFQQFPVSFGPLPQDAGSLVFKTLQTYDNGDIVRWIEVPQTGQPEPENPAPTLTLTAATAAGTAGTPAAAPADDASKGGAAPATTAAGSGSDDTARGLGIAGIVVGAAGVAFGVLAGRRRSTRDGAGAGTGSGTPA